MEASLAIARKHEEQLKASVAAAEAASKPENKKKWRQALGLDRNGKSVSDDHRVRRWFVLPTTALEREFAQLKKNQPQLVAQGSVAKSLYTVTRADNQREQVAPSRLALSVLFAYLKLPLPDEHVNRQRFYGRGGEQEVNGSVFKLALRVIAAGRIVAHEQMYERAALKPVFEGGDTPDTVPKLVRMDVSYGAPKPARRLTWDELARVLMLHHVLELEYPDWMPVIVDTNARGRRSTNVRFPQVVKDACEAVLKSGQSVGIDHSFHADKLSLLPIPKGDDMPALTDHQFAQSEANRHSLPFHRFPAVLMATEAFSAGCIRCCRPFYSPDHFYVQDTARTQILRSLFVENQTATREIIDGRRRVLHTDKTLNRLLTVSAERLRETAADNDADDDPTMRAYPLDLEKVKINGVETLFAQSRLVGSMDVQEEGAVLYPLKQRICWDNDEFADDILYACNVRGLLTIVVKYKNPNPPNKVLSTRFGTNPTQLRDKNYADKPKIALYRYNSVRASSNLCFECGKQLDSSGVRLLDGFRPMEFNFNSELAKNVAVRTHDAGTRRYLAPTTLTDQAKSLLENAIKAKELHEQLVQDGADRTVRNPRTVRFDDGSRPPVKLPFSYITWARKWTQTYGPYEPDDPPPFDLNVLLRMGLISPREYAEALGASPLPSRLSNANVEISVGDVRTGLAMRHEKKEDSIARHTLLAEQVQALLNGDAVDSLAFELQQTLKDMAVHHHQSASQLQRDSEAVFQSVDAPEYEWYRVVEHKKTRWREDVDISDERKRATKLQMRSVQQSKFLLTLVLHRRATYEERHSAHILQMMADSARALFESPHELAKLFKFGLTWKGGDVRAWQTWMPRKAAAETTGVGHYKKEPTRPERETVFTKAEYSKALHIYDEDEEVDESTTEAEGGAVLKFWNHELKRPYELRDLQDHPYANSAQGSIFFPDEYMTDYYEDVVRSVQAHVGCEIGPVARLFHFHMLLDVKHLSKMQLDERAFKEYFLSCWLGLLFDGQYRMTDHSGNDWIQPSERLYLQTKLLAEDTYSTTMEAYVKKQSVGFMQAGLQALRRQEASHSLSVIAQARNRDTTVGNAADGVPPPFARRTMELVNQPIGTPAGRMPDGQPNALSVNRDAIVRARGEQRQANFFTEAQSATTMYELGRQLTILENTRAMDAMGLPNNLRQLEAAFRAELQKSGHTEAEVRHSRQ